MEKVFPTHIVAAAGIVENENGEILLVKTHNHQWVFPGGQVENGENVPDAVIREFKEESGVDIKVDKLFCVTSNTSSYEGYNGYKTVPTKVMFDFICTLADSASYSSDFSSDETTAVLWVKKENVMDYLAHPTYRERFQAYLDFNGTVRYLEYAARPEYKLKLKRNI